MSFMMETQTQKLKEQGASRDFFCVVSDAFRVFARRSSDVLGSPWAFVMAILVIVVWAATGPTFHFSDTWQLIINTGTTIVTFLMVFLIQNTQNRDSEAMHVKMDELIRALEGAHNALLDLEELDDLTLDTIRDRYRKLAAKARKDVEAGKLDVGCEEVDDDDGEDDASSSSSRGKTSKKAASGRGKS
jgi:low affinity Fe/Cu permease